jgi:Raf kinase inhibitor-like YbhB/YbcL family protein
MRILSPEFGHAAIIPAKYTCDGANISPPLLITDVPSSARSLALVVEDPDAVSGTFTHWLLGDIPVSVEEIHENTAPGVTGENDFQKVAYGGPCPTSGTHRYVFTLYALDCQLNLQPGMTKTVLLEAMQGHVVAQSELVGHYKKGGTSA